jgi:surface polysaccharide O-acyltransferase-like enzyme
MNLSAEMSETIEVGKKNKDKLYELDYMRFIACLAVMIVHITATGVTGYIHGSFPHLVVLLVNKSLKFTTPIFIFLSGVTSFYSYRQKEFKYFSFLKKRLAKVLMAYLLWCVIYYLSYIEIGYHHAWDSNFFITSVLQGTISYHLYFVIIIVQMYIVGPVLYHFLKTTDKKITILFVAGVVTLLSAEFIRFELSDRLFLKYVFFYMLGIYVTLERDLFLSFVERHKTPVIAGYLIAGLAFTAVSYYDMSITTYVWFFFSVLSVFFVYYVGLVMKELFSKYYSFIKLFGQSSYYIYLMHPLVLTVMILYAENNGILSVTKRLILYSATVMPVTIISCLIFTAVRNKIKKKKREALAEAAN